MPADEQVLLQLAKGLDYIHSNKIVHRDVKPHNVLFSIGSAVDDKNHSMTMKWADFGLSKPLGDDDQFSLTATGMGTRCWIAPEILEKDSHLSSDGSNAKISFKSDIWSAGCVFFYYLTKGKHPFGDLNHFTQLHTNVMRGTPINMKSI